MQPVVRADQCQQCHRFERFNSAEVFGRAVYKPNRSNDSIERILISNVDTAACTGVVQSDHNDYLSRTSSTVSPLNCCPPPLPLFNILMVFVCATPHKIVSLPSAPLAFVSVWKSRPCLLSLHHPINPTKHPYATNANAQPPPLLPPHQPPLTSHNQNIQLTRLHTPTHLVLRLPLPPLCCRCLRAVPL